MESNLRDGTVRTTEEAEAEPQVLVAQLAPEPWVDEAWIAPPRRRRVWLPLGLFVATILSTFLAQALYVDGEFRWHFMPLQGLEYSAAVMTILLCHEMGHFIQAWRYGVHASWPYFLPMPFSPIGTLGAVIVMEPGKGDRRALFDIGISGPLAGLLPALVCCAVGLAWSKPVVPGGDAGTGVGSSLLFSFLARVFGPGDGPIDLHPLAFAGWVGLLVTAINLVPIGQLDGGHVIYGLMRGKARWLALLFLVGAMVAIAKSGYWWWSPMLFLLVFIGIRHPPTADDRVPLGPVRYVLGWLTLALMPLAFAPIPFLGTVQ
jgi:membrane-associated protease RseP (regulator of RpoE activity)